MAIAYDSSAKANTTGNATSLTFAHTCTGSDLILFVNVAMNVTTDYVTGITYGGVAMTKVPGGFRAQSYGGNVLYYLLAPATGANNIVISATSCTFAGASASYTGAAQSAQPDAQTVNGVDANTTLATALNTVADNCWMVSALGGNNADAATGGAGTTSRQGQGGGSGVSVSIGDSNGAITPAGSYSMTWNFSSAYVSVVQASFAPVAPTTTSTSSSTSTSTTSTSSSTSTTSTSSSTTSTSSSTTSTSSSTSISTSTSSSISTSTTSTSSSTSTTSTSSSTSTSISTSTSSTTTLDYHFYIDNEGAARNLSFRIDHGDD